MKRPDVPTARNAYARAPLHPAHAFLLACTFPLFLGVLLNDWAYATTYEIQWKNFASWLLVGALIFGGMALLWALITLFRARARGRPLISFLLLLAAWLLGFVNALIHAKDAWASMPEALILAILTLVVAAAAAWLGFSNLRAGAVK